jgi:MFS transporter, DHA1 family, multidrug resistance protein
MFSWRPRRPSFGPLEPWQRDQYVVVLTVALAHLALDFTQPFIPLYIRELGVADLAEAAFWSGMVVGAAPLCASIMGPFWGALADRYGRKPMIIRALLTIGAMQFATAFVPDVYWLLGARMVLGTFAGFGAMVMALAISLGPRTRMAHAIGMVQAAQFLPLAIGPAIGGAIADAYGLRANFILTGVIMLVPALFLHVFVRESSYDGEAELPPTKRVGGRVPVLALLTVPGFAMALAILFMARFTDRALPPILPLYLVELDTPAGQLATITGVVVGSGAVAAACSSMLYGRWARPESTRRLLVFALVGGAACSALLGLASGWPDVVALRLVLGLLAGGSMSLAFTFGARLAPPERSGLTLSLLSGGGQLGGAVSPVLVGLIGQFSLRYVFIVNAAAYLIAAVLAGLPSRDRDRASRAET